MSVCGTGTVFLLSNFSRQREFISFRYFSSLPASLSLDEARTSLRFGLAPQPPFTIRVGLTILLCHCISNNVLRWCRNICLLSIIYGFRPQLRPRLTLGGRTFPRKPETFDGGDSRSAFATYTGILSCMHSTAPFDTASARIHCSSTNRITPIPKLRCQVLAPIIFGALSLDQ